MPLIPMSQAESYEPVPVATYEVALDEWEYVEESASSGEPFVKLVFAIDDGGEYDGRKLFWNRSCQLKSLRYLKKALVTLGADEEEISADFDIEDVMPDLVGNRCRAVVGIREYEGDEVNEVKRILPLA